MKNFAKGRREACGRGLVNSVQLWLLGLWSARRLSLCLIPKPRRKSERINNAISCDGKPNPQLGASRFRHQQADALRISSRTVERMIHLPAFQEELDRLGYQGERRFRKAQRAQRDDERTQKPESEATVAPNDRYTGTPSREGHRRPRGHQSQLQYRPALDSRLEAQMTAWGHGA